MTAIIFLCLTILVAKTGAARSAPSMASIIRAVFPDRTEEAALRVARCESNLQPGAYNPSGASGLFQILQGNAGRVLRYRGKTLTIPRGRTLFDPWVNATVALFLSRGGTDWREWSCGWAARQ